MWSRFRAPMPLKATECPSESETRGPCWRGPRFRHGTNANPEAFEVNLAERHQPGVEITPDKQQQKGHSGVVFVLDGVHHCCGEVEAQRDLSKRHPAGAFAVSLQIGRASCREREGSHV